MYALLGVISPLWLQAAPVDELLDTDRAFASLSAEKGAQAAFKAYLGDDAMQLSAGAFPVFGIDAIVASFDQVPADFQLLWQPQSGEVAASGELGWTWGIYQAIYSAEGQSHTSHGKYLNIWHLVQGHWKLAVDMGNSNPGAWQVEP